MERKIQTIASIRTLHLQATLDDVLLQNNQVSRRIRIEHPPAAAMVAFLTDEAIVMVRQFRYALGRETLEIPAGKLEPGEEPLTGIQRELREETGYLAGRIEPLITFAPAVAYSNELIHIFCGRDLRRIAQKTDEAEISAVETVPVDRLKELIREGQIQDGKTLLGLALAGIPSWPR